MADDLLRRTRIRIADAARSRHDESTATCSSGDHALIWARPAELVKAVDDFLV
jgi:hypothetical protein